jgi:hypothetical protein
VELFLEQTVELDCCCPLVEIFVEKWTTSVQTIISKWTCESVAADHVLLWLNTSYEVLFAQLLCVWAKL